MGHGGETIVCSPSSHQSGYHHPQVGAPHSKKHHSFVKVNGGGVGINHDISKGSTNVSKKSHMHSHSTPQPRAKPQGKGRHSQGNNASSSNGNRTKLVAPQQHTPFQLMKQHSLPNANRQMNATTQRQKSFSPPTLHPIPSRDAKPRTNSPLQPGSKSKDKEHFYAGARFETHPSHVGLPVPPSHWTAPIQRSQSQPTSPVPTSLPQKGVSVDLATLFGNSDSVLKSASFPGERLMDALMKVEDERKKKNEMINTVSFGSLLQAQVTNSYECNDDTDELKKALGLASFTSPVKAAARLNNDVFNSNGSEMSPSKYQDISDQLKNLLKVAA